MKFLAVLWTLTLCPFSLEWMRRKKKEATMTLKWDIPIPIGNGAAYDFGVPLAIFTVRHGFAFWHSWHVRIIPLRVSFSLNAERHKWIGHFEPKKKWTHEKWNETNIELKLRRRGERRKPKWRFVCDKQIDENGYKSFGFFYSSFFVLICLEVPWPNIGWNGENRNEICSYEIRGTFWLQKKHIRCF